MASVAPTDAPGLLEASSGPSPIAWVLHDGMAGMTSQALDTARAGVALRALVLGRRKQA